MAAIPRLDRLSKAYLTRQVDRVVATLERIFGRPALASGRVIPEANDLAIHDGRVLKAAVMFLDICAFSNRPSWSASEQQAVLDTLSLFFSEMIRIIQDYGGVVEKNTGDGLMAYFTADGDRATASHRAVAAALTMFDARWRLINPILQSSGIAPLDFRICLDHGPVTIARLGAHRGFNGMAAIGTTANMTAKMLGVAKANQLLVGTAAREGLPPAWQAQFFAAEPISTTWIYRYTGAPYFFWDFTGRWTEPSA